MDSRITALAIAPEREREYLAPLYTIPGLSLLVSAHLRQEQAQQSQLIILFATNYSTINQWLIQIRGQVSLSLLPVLAIAPENSLSPYQTLADEIAHFPLSLSQLESKLKHLFRLYQLVDALSALAEQLTPQEGQLTNLLRYFVTREIRALTPTRFLDSRLGYAYPLVAAFLNTSLGEELVYLQELEQLGLLQGTGYDRLHLCPKCDYYQLNFREVCPKCQLPHISREGNIHHYSCGYIAPESEFYNRHQLICPKCQKQLRHIGVDHDKPSVSYRCQRCRNIFPEAVVNCLCINCGNVFLPKQAHLAEVKEYRLTLAGIRAAQAGVIREIPEHLAIKSPWETVSYSVFEEMFRIQLWISKRLLRPFCLIGMVINEEKDHRHKQADSKGTNWLTNLLKENLRGNDLISQISDEQFLILSPETDRESAGLAMQRVTKRIGDKLNGHRLNVAIAQLPQDGEDIKQLTAKLLGG
jgi:uncharacterized OB-fold protein